MILNHGTKYKSFSYMGEKISIKPGSGKKLPFQCRCGKTQPIKLAYITCGQKTCSRCNEIELKKEEKFGNFIYLGDTKFVSKGSKKRELFKCKCGNIKEFVIREILNGAKSCKKCTTVSLKTGDKYFDFIYLGHNIEISSGSYEKLKFQCKCGKIDFRALYAVISGRSKSCGKCHSINLIKGEKYHEFIYIGENIEITPGSKRKLLFQCRCGANKLIQLGGITRGDSRTCGSCFVKAGMWYENNKEMIRSIKCPAYVNDFPSGGLIPTHVVKNSIQPFEAICPLCSSKYYPALHSIKRGVSLTCGCSHNKISAYNQQIAKFINSLGLKSEFEFKLNGKFFDVAVPDKKLLIELHGLRWHSNRKTHMKDFRKFKEAIEAGFEVIAIFEDEWKLKRQIMENLIKNRLSLQETMKTRPSKCEIRHINPSEANKFYETYHYIGKCPSRYKYGIFYKSELIGCVSFRKPVRQNSKGEYELSRMILNPKFRIHGIWSKILSIFVKEIQPKSIISYSDNRLFSGKVYENMGFKFDGEVKPDYYWTKGHKRFHKSKLRKPKNETRTENELRIAEGYMKILDYGKKRWFLEM